MVDLRNHLNCRRGWFATRDALHEQKRIRDWLSSSTTTCIFQQEVAMMLQVGKTNRVPCLESYIGYSYNRSVESWNHRKIPWSWATMLWGQHLADLSWQYEDQWFSWLEIIVKWHPECLLGVVFMHHRRQTTPHSRIPTPLDERLKPYIHRSHHLQVSSIPEGLGFAVLSAHNFPLCLAEVEPVSMCCYVLLHVACWILIMWQVKA